MQSRPPALPRISVVVLTHDRAGQLVGTLARLASLPEQPPVIVADNASRDETVKLVDMLFPQVRVVQCGTDLGAAGRNRAVACVRTDYVAFCDDDSWWEPGSLALAVKLLDGAPQVAVLNARVVTGESGALDPRCRSMAASPLAAPGCPAAAVTSYIAGACVFRTAVFRAVGGYERRFGVGGEEALVALDVLDAGHTIAYCNELTVRRGVFASDTAAALDRFGRRRTDRHDSPDDACGSEDALQRRVQARNAAWVAWLRLPWRDVGRSTCAALATFAHEHTLWRDGAAMIAGLPWALVNRHRVNAQVLATRAEARAAQRRLARGAQAECDAQNARHTVAEPRSHDH
ncbi:glycosyltransferase [Paraburkholderia sp. SARCC-3016]|uniref:glycosyltransferase family 2 protein n=1 Tax=Paraburkholderia sp. SARCC-3016 TaxID=3058611 RepID=UPI002809251C|nr:glycosyltransferase [Paraburkholderia sp. SARCC-3016]MDQ7977611.1 glycosyltransferase [Paraburkholderia sp. SARCC-3016]